MSTKGTLFYRDPVHVYHDIIDDWVWVEVGDKGFSVRLMTYKWWNRIVWPIKRRFGIRRLS